MAGSRDPRPRATVDRKALLRVLRAVGRDDFSVRMPALLDGIDGELADAFNDIARINQAMTAARADQAADHQANAQIREKALQRANQRLRQNARRLHEQVKQIEDKNREVELAKAAVEDKAAQLALSLRYKSEFLANMSHELRTPLNSLLILAQMLAENPAGNLVPKQVEYAQTIQAAGNDLLALINDVLDLAKIESGTVTLNIAAEHFSHLRDHLDRTFSQLGHGKGLQFRISMARGLPPAIRTDANRLRQILKNLLSNAFKFTSEGAVSVELALASAGWSAGHPVLDGADGVVAFSVIDTGIGIPADKQKIIFEEFQQADGTTSRRFGGTGLGLSISSRLAHLLGGEITVQSAYGNGSTFTLYLPFSLPGEPEDQDFRLGIDAPAQSMDVPAQIVPAEAPPRSTGGSGPSARRRPESPTVKGTRNLAGRRVLIVDDDVRSIFALTGALEQRGMVVMNAENGADAIELLKKNPRIDVILMDMMMPELDGYATLRIMRSLEHFRNVPIIGVSARAMRGDGRKAIEAGASGYISKPVGIDDLLSLMRRLVGEGEATKRASRTAKHK